MSKASSPVPIEDSWTHCPRCGASAGKRRGNPFSCTDCGYTHYFGPCTAVGGIVTDKQGQVLLLLRARDPGKGKFGIPGGFVDAGETPEDALKREIMEEVGLKVTRFSYLCSFPNQYAYKGVVLPVADLFYQVSVRSFSGMKPQEGEIDGWVFCHPGRKELNNLAFESNRKALQFYLRQQKKKGTGQ